MFCGNHTSVTYLAYKRVALYILYVCYACGIWVIHPIYMNICRPQTHLKSLLYLCLFDVWCLHVNIIVWLLSISTHYENPPFRPHSQCETQYDNLEHFDGIGLCIGYI